MAGTRPPIEAMQCKKCGMMCCYLSQCRRSIIQANATSNDQVKSYYQDIDDNNANNDFELMFVATSIYI